LKFIDNILYIEFQEMESLSIPSRTMRHWDNIKDPSDRRRVLIQYETLKDKYKQLIIARYGNPYEYMACLVIKQYLIKDTEAYKYFSEYVLSDGKGLPVTYIERYTKSAEWLNLLVKFDNETVGFKKKFNMSRDDFFENVIRIITAEQIDLPKTYARLRDKIAQYKDGGYQVLISGKFGNANSEKITAQAVKWLVARYADPINKIDVIQLHQAYNQKALAEGLKPIKSAEAIRLVLELPENKRLWYGSRFGELKAKEKFAYPLKTELPQYRDALWYSDGTKLNFYYQDENGQMSAKLKVYEVIDVYSECLLGFHIGYSEDFAAQYMAYKAAIQFSGNKPYEIRYDNQGGHKKLKNDSFLGKLSKLSFNTQPYNGKSKTIESIFNRLQSQMSSHWFFTGKNVGTKSINSKPNMEFINFNKHKLPTEAQLIDIYKLEREKWNNTYLPKHGKTRLELYLSSVNPQSQPVGYLEMVDMFWIQSKGNRYLNSGLRMQINKQTYEFEVLNDQNKPDALFRKKYIDTDFIVKYDPSELSHVRLYLDTPAGLQFVAVAQSRITVKRASQDQLPGDRSLITELNNFAKQERIEMREEIEEILTEFELTPEQQGFETPVLRGIQKRKGKSKDTFGAFLKAESMRVQDDSDDKDIYDIM
jgi:hypothetical protein